MVGYQINLQIGEERRQLSETLHFFVMILQLLLHITVRDGRVEQSKAAVAEFGHELEEVRSPIVFNARFQAALVDA